MRVSVVGHYLGLLTAAAFAISMGITVGGGLLIFRLVPHGEGRMNRREAVLLVIGGWTLASLASSLPYAFAGSFANYIDSLFEAVSGFTTTGATVFTSVEAQPQSILLWRAITQWLGGMGIITLFVALFPVLGIGAAHLVEAEMPGPDAGRLTPRIRDTAKAVWMMYVSFTVLELVALLIAGLPLLDALTVTFSTMPTGGFTATNASILAYDNVAVEAIVTFFMLIAGVNFGLYYFLVWKRQPKQLLRSPELRVYLGILLVASILVAVDLGVNAGMSTSQAFRRSTFQVVSIMTTTGFASADFAMWPAFARSALLMLMIVGASAGSTGGALKVVRLMVAVKYSYNQLLRAFNPRVVVPLKLGGNIIPSQVVSGIIAMAALYFLTIMVGFLAMNAVGLDHVTALSSVIASVGNVGPGLNLVGPMETYQFIPPVGKVVLMTCMLVGRLELFTMMVVIVPAFWRWR
jgi:trk system potassium uptake protein TrkH